MSHHNRHYRFDELSGWAFIREVIAFLAHVASFVLALILAFQGEWAQACFFAVLAVSLDIGTEFREIKRRLK